MFFTFFKLYIWYQLAQRTTYERMEYPIKIESISAMFLSINYNFLNQLLLYGNKKQSFSGEISYLIPSHIVSLNTQSGVFIVNFEHMSHLF